MAECHLCISPQAVFEALGNVTYKHFTAYIQNVNVGSNVTTGNIGTINLGFIPSTLLIDPAPTAGGSQKSLTIVNFVKTAQYQVWKDMSGSGTRPTVWMKFLGSSIAKFITDTPNYTFSFSYNFMAFG